MADILIRDVEMPNSCLDCDVLAHCKHRDPAHSYYFSKMPPECPIFPLPEWHGRLTDADELFDTMRFHRDHAELNDVRLGLDEAVGVVMNAPTIIEAEGDF